MEQKREYEESLQKSLGRETESPADTNDDAMVDIGDAITLLGVVFSGLPGPPPFGLPGFPGAPPMPPGAVPFSAENGYRPPFDAHPALRPPLGIPPGGKP